MSSLYQQAKRAAAELKASYKRRYDRCIAQSKLPGRNANLVAADKAEAARIKRAYL